MTLLLILTGISLPSRDSSLGCDDTMAKAKQNRHAASVEHAASPGSVVCFPSYVESARTPPPPHVVLFYFYGESPWSPPPRENFTTPTKDRGETLGDLDFVEQVVLFVCFFFFYTVNHRGPLPLRELHSTDET